MRFGFFTADDSDDQVGHLPGVAGPGQNFFEHGFQKAAIPFEHRAASIIEVLTLIGVGPDDFGSVIAGFDGDDVDAEGSQFDPDGLSKTNEGMFAGCISGVEGVTDETGQGGNVDDAAAFALNHLRDDGTGQPDGTEVVGLKDSFRFLLCEIQKRAGNEDTRVINQDVYGRELLNHLVNGGGICDIQAFNCGGKIRSFKGLPKGSCLIEISHGGNDFKAFPCRFDGG